MSVWSARRFWTDATVHPEAGGFAVHLDARPLRTPRKAPLILPTKALAQAVAAEWQAQEGKVNPATMPFTRTANSAIDKVAPQFAEVVAMLAEYGGSDLLCYRATGPAKLIDRQAAAWDPLLDWAARELQAPLIATAGVMHIRQPEASLATLHGAVQAMSPFQLSAFHDLVAMSGSLVLALAVTRGRLTVEQAWELSRVDENWQIEAWGADEEAAEITALKHAAFVQANRFYALCG
ncbi:ATP12 family protein [Tabrizicola sp.]|uniref:ATP12 family chaperone protein n=1 Tax=Tabrizicola sp. TaxID=2005166 RepID=UPI0026180690|nr:ATP12 family protein [Tabrizicola sp.]MDM7933204.1 ATP12 family protein [Tabrizicola sp.]